MIGKLRGTVDEVGEGHVVLDVGGVGYVAHCPASTLAGLVPGQEGTLLIETVVREDMIRLFGFSRPSEREWFLLLQSVQGVGSKVALAILGFLPPGALAAAIASDDRASITKVPGVGPKLAQRLASELRGKVPEGLSADVGGTPSAAVPAGPAEDAVSALVNLGYPRSLAAGAVSRAVAEAGDGAPLGALVRQGLRFLSSAA